MSLQPVPVSDEQAKAIQETAKLGSKSLDVAKEVGGYVSRIFGTLPENLVGLLGADWVEFKRFENLAKLTKRARAILEDLRVTETNEVPLSIGLPLLHAAADESRDELLELWARLLASAMNPQRSQFVRRSFVEIVKQFDPLDALVFDFMDGHTSYHPNICDAFASRFKTNSDAIEVSFTHLEVLGVAERRDWINRALIPDVRFTALGRELKRALPPQT